MHRIHRTAWAGLAIALTLAGTNAASAQNVGAGAGHPFHAILLTTGMTTMSVDPLNARITSSQFASLSNDAVSYGGSGYVAVGRALLGAQAHRSTFGEEGLNNGRTDDLSSAQAAITVGYAIISTEHVSLFPELGVGLGRIEVTLRDRSGAGTASAQPTFDEIAQAPGAESTMTGRHLLYSFGGGADYLVTRRGSSVGVVMGVRAGLAASPNRATWTRNGQAVVAGPDAGAGGPYLRVMVGLGGR
ncbi:MAG TPA: hypothetical protein VGP25_00745 [Gemmatimonadaceae bacterium]|jgi:hypothetical protein|nr:hypothetical protein [Gemmatimonadaceae bacterium]